MMANRAGILGLGLDVPSEIRRNDWWPDDVVAGWVARRSAAPRPAIPQPITDGMRCVLDAAAAYASDPFQGAVERRVLPPGASVLDMEERAARLAIERSGIDPAAIDLLLTHTVVPDHQLANPASTLHHRLGLPIACLAMHTEATAYSFLGQLGLAEAAIASGRARHALLVQSCAATRLVERDDPSSAVIGDGATAVVLGPVADPRGLRSIAHYTDGRYPLSLVMTVPGGRWYDDGRARVQIGDPQQLFEAQVQTADVCRAAAEAALAAAQHAVSDIDYWCIFQGTAWMHRAVGEHLGAPAQKFVEVFRRFGYLSAATIPATLYLAELEGLLMRDDLVLLTGGGTGMTYGAAVLRWGMT